MRIAWTTVAMMLAVIQWFIGNPVIHWAACASIGFAGGIWLDDLLRRLAARFNRMPVARIAEKDFLDYESNCITLPLRWIDCYCASGREDKWAGDKMEKQVVKRKEISSSVGANGLAPETALRIQVIADITALIFEKYAADIGVANKKLYSLVSVVTIATEWKIKNQSPSKTAASTDYLDDLRTHCLRVRKEIIEFI